MSVSRSRVADLGARSGRFRRSGLDKKKDFVGRVSTKSRILSVGIKKSGGSALGDANNVGYSRVAESA